MHAEWLNENAYRAYPFQEDMRLVPMDADGNLLTGVVLPNYLVVDLVFTLADQYTDTRLYMSQLVIAGNLVTMAFSETRTHQIACTASLNRAVHVANQGYNLVGSGEWDDGRGRIAIGNIASLSDDLADGIYTLSADQALLEACVVRPALRGVRSLQIQNGTTVSDAVKGRVRLVAGANIRLDAGQVDGQDALYISAVPNSSYAETCDCASVLSTNVVRTINGIPVNDITFVPASSTLRITTDGNKLVFDDTTATPCCGCEELKYLTEALRTMQATLTQLEAYAQQIESRINTFVTNYVIYPNPLPTL